MKHARTIWLYFVSISMFFCAPYITGASTVKSQSRTRSVSSTRTLPEKPIVAIIPSYNNKEWYLRNLSSVVSQQYTNFRVIYINAASTDGTGDLVAKFINEHNLHSRVQLLHNAKRCCPIENIYNAHQLCSDNEIAVVVDGDDWLMHDQVFKMINAVYTDPNVWMTYGQFVHFPTNDPCSYRAVPDWVIQTNSFRSYKWTTSHLRTNYVWLFKCIKKEDLMLNGQFFPSTGDQAYMFPMLEMAGFHSRFIPTVLYSYNIANPINDNKVDAQLQRDCERIIRSRAPYAPLNARP